MGRENMTVGKNYLVVDLRLLQVGAAQWLLTYDTKAFEIYIRAMVIVVAMNACRCPYCGSVAFKFSCVSRYLLSARMPVRRPVYRFAHSGIGLAYIQAIPKSLLCFNWIAMLLREARQIRTHDGIQRWRGSMKRCIC